MMDENKIIYLQDITNTPPIALPFNSFSGSFQSDLLPDSTTSIGLIKSPIESVSEWRSITTQVYHLVQSCPEFIQALLEIDPNLHELKTEKQVRERYYAIRQYDKKMKNRNSNASQLSFSDTLDDDRNADRNDDCLDFIATPFDQLQDEVEIDLTGPYACVFNNSYY